MRGEFVELVPHERIVFTFGWDPTDGARRRSHPGRRRVEVTLTPDGDDTILALRHTGLPPSIAERPPLGLGPLPADPRRPGQPHRAVTVTAAVPLTRCRPATRQRRAPRSVWTRDWVPSRPRPCACSAT